MVYTTKAISISKFILSVKSIGKQKALFAFDEKLLQIQFCGMADFYLRVK